MRVFLELAYDGTRYHGWQRQPNAMTVQEVLEDTMARFFGEVCSLMGCGRTDAGVHAKYFVAHAMLPEGCVGEHSISLDEAVLKLNGMLPHDIGIYAMHRVKDNSHARFDAVERGYTYWVHTHKDPFLRSRSTRIYGQLDLAAMEAASKHLIRKGDFASFCKAGSDQGTTICNVQQAHWEVLTPHRMAFHISADRFLRNMVRATVGTLIEVGKGRRHPDDLVDILDARDRSAAGKSVLGCGLYLTKVVYPKDVFTPAATEYL